MPGALTKSSGNVARRFYARFIPHLCTRADPSVYSALCSFIYRTRKIEARVPRASAACDLGTVCSFLSKACAKGRECNVFFLGGGGGYEVNEAEVLVLECRNVLKAVCGGCLCKFCIWAITLISFGRAAALLLTVMALY